MIFRANRKPIPRPETLFIDAKGDADLFDEVARLMAHELARRVQAEREALSQAVDEVDGTDLGNPSRRRARL